MDIRSALREASALLENSETPFLDAGLLLASVLGISREKLLASYPEELPDQELKEFRKLIEKRLKGIPVSYLLNRKEFFGRTFYVDERVLVPRPDTEILVETALGIISEIFSERQGQIKTTGAPWTPVRLIDICTGTGCVPITIALETGKLYPGLQISAGEISPEAMEVFRINAEKLGTPEIKLYKSDLLSDIPEKFDIITSNPPYIKTGETADMKNSGWPEPALALDGGEDGLDLIRKLAAQSAGKLNPGGWLMMEAGWDQMIDIRIIMEENGFSNVTVLKDLAGRDRVIMGMIGK